MPSDVALYHELTHAYHMHLGDVATGAATPPVAPIDAGTRNAEYQVTGLGAYAGASISENAYRRERTLLGDPQPDRDHYSPRFRVPPPPLPTETPAPPTKREGSTGEG
jgi:hypothetical protein